MTRAYLFDMAVTVKDKYDRTKTRWDQALEVTVEAVNRDEAFIEALRVMGEPPAGGKWTARFLNARPAPACTYSRKDCSHDEN